MDASAASAGGPQRGGGDGPGSSAQVPQLVVRLQELLARMGVEEYEPRVVNQLVDFVYRYVSDVLLDAEAYSAHAGRPPGTVDLSNLTLAIQARSALSFVQPPTREDLAHLAALVNDKEMPRFPGGRTGLLIPPDEKDCLTAPNYQINTSGT